MITTITVALSTLGACDARREAEVAPSSASASAADAPEIVTPTVAWPPASSIDGATLAEMPDEARGVVGRSVVPVLAPRDVDLATAKLVVGPEFCALSVRHRGAMVVVHGTRAAKRYDGIAPQAGDKALRGGRGFVTENERVRRATWIEGGVAYSVDVECGAPDDTRCSEEGYVTALVDGLVYVGGAGR